MAEGGSGVRGGGWHVVGKGEREVRGSYGHEEGMMWVEELECGLNWGGGGGQRRSGLVGWYQNLQGQLRFCMGGVWVCVWGGGARGGKEGADWGGG